MNPAEPKIDSLIRTLRDQRVILDADLAVLYGVPTFRFNEAFKRNRDRFPPEFAFQLTAAESAALNWSQTVTSPSQDAGGECLKPDSSQFAMSSRKHRGATYRPWAFTEHGALMAANILRSPRARQMSISNSKHQTRNPKQAPILQPPEGSKHGAQPGFFTVDLLNVERLYAATIGNERPYGAVAG